MMRKQRWTPVLGMVALAIVASSAQAQPDPFNTPGGGPAVTSSIRPISYPAPPGMGQAGIPSHQPVVPPGTQNANAERFMRPWPGISPFENRYERHEIRDGLWQRETNNSRRRYFTGVNAMFFQMQPPEQTLFGDKGAHRLLGAFPDGRDTVTLRQQFFVQNTTGGTNFIGKRVFDFPFKTEGVRVNWGFWDPDDTGFESVTWWASDVFYEFALFEEFDPANPPPFTPRGPVIPARLPNGGATIMYFDGSFTLRYRQSAANTQFSRLMRRIWEWGPLNVRPLWGGRYTLVREGMFFSGYDFFPTGPYQTTLNSKTTSHLAGPEVGLQTEIGSDVLKVTMGTRFILYVNHEKQRLSGNNFVDIFTQPLLGTQSLAFAQQRNSTHLSPAFEQTVHFESKIFQYIPGLNRIAAIRNAKMRGGLTYLDIGLMARPSKSVRFTAFPGSPTMQTKRSKFSLFAWDVGIHFEY